MDTWDNPDIGLQLFIADTGGNNTLKETFQVYIVSPPSLETNQILAQQKQISFEAFGPRDLEAFAIDPLTGDWYFLNKGWWSPSQFFVIQEDGRAEYVANFSNEPILKTSKELQTKYTPDIIGRLQPSSSKHMTTFGSQLQWYRSLPFFPTSMDFSPDGMTLIVWSYVFGYVYERNNSQTWREVLEESQPQKHGKSSTPCRFILPIRKNNIQGETIFFDQEGEYIYLLSENLSQPHPIYKMKRKKH